MLQQVCTQNDTFNLGLLSQGIHFVDYSMYYNNLGFGQTECSSFQYADTMSINFLVGPNAGNIPVDIHPQGEHHICVGDSVELHADAFANQTFQWIFNGAFLWNETQPEIIAKDSGFYQLRVYENGDSGTSDAILVHVHSSPQDDLLQNGNVVSTNYPSVAFEWFEAQNGLITGADSASIEVTATGNYFVKLESAFGCLGQSDTLYVELIDAEINPSGNIELCSYDSIILSASPVGNQYSYQWLMDAQLLAGDTNSDLIVSASGSYRCVVSISQSADSSNAADVTEWPTTVPTVDFDGVTFSASPALTYQWYSIETGIIVGATQQTYTPTVSGNYYVVVQDSNSCEGYSNAINFELTGMPALSSENNVTTKMNGPMLTLAFEPSFTGTLTLLDLSGRLLLTKTISGRETNIQLDMLPSGIYVIKCTAADGKQMAIPLCRP